MTKQPKKYISIKVDLKTKERIDTLSQYLECSIIRTINLCVSGFQAKIMLNHIEKQRKLAEAEEQWDKIVSTLEKAKREKKDV